MLAVFLVLTAFSVKTFGFDYCRLVCVQFDVIQFTTSTLAHTERDKRKKNSMAIRLTALTRSYAHFKKIIKTFPNKMLLFAIRFLRRRWERVFFYLPSTD